MRREDLYLRDIVEAADHVAAFIAGMDFERFLASELLCSAVAQKLSLIGEAAARISTDYWSSHPEVPWARVVAFRNILVHAYFSIDWQIVWHAATHDCPSLRAQIAEILRVDFPDIAT